MDKMDDLAAFVAIIEKGGQTAAARYLRRSVQSINRSLAMLERTMDLELISRTTRQSVPTATGLAFYRRLKPALAEISDARREAISRRTDISGLLRVGAPVLFASAYVMPAICEFLERNPQIKIDLKVSDRQVDILQQELDLAVRIRHIPDSGLKTRRLGEMRTVVFGAPSYFALHGYPGHPGELGRHHCILRTTEDPGAERWPFRIGGKHKRISVQGRFRTDSAAAAQAAVARGLGIGFAPLWQIRGLVDSGEVEVILQEFESGKIPVHVVWSPTRVPLAGAKLFREFLVARLKAARF
jgi:DNA-binding transcriptional LysR family regulator